MTAASHHFCKDWDLYIQFKLLHNYELAVAVEGAMFLIKGTEIVERKLNGEIVSFEDVMHYPSLR